MELMLNVKIRKIIFYLKIIFFKDIEGGKIKFNKECSLGKKGEERNILELIKELNKNNKRWLMPNEEQGDNHYLKLNIDGHAMAILINNFGEEKGRCNLFRLYFL
ncbi:unnamed protein product [Meloidogyne enterolobii]|uniref:Uncharacterized protein n=1 Tax=Meloidogyne enterolobii TaxID=390850 RepID=A0ACB0XSG2_MELEN